MVKDQVGDIVDVAEKWCADGNVEAYQVTAVSLGVRLTVARSDGSQVMAEPHILFMALHRDITPAIKQEFISRVHRDCERSLAVMGHIIDPSMELVLETTEKEMIGLSDLCMDIECARGKLRAAGPKMTFKWWPARLHVGSWPRGHLPDWLLGLCPVHRGR
jgi:hypothetical protein